MKNYMKKILAVVLVCLMIMPMSLSSFAAMTVGSTVTTNWTPMAAKYAYGTWNLNVLKNQNYAIKTDGFSFSEDADGGISVYSPTKAEHSGGYGTSLVTSKATTALDNLTVQFGVDEFDSIIDNTAKGNTLAMLWSEEQITEIASMSDPTTNTYDRGLYNAKAFYANGFRPLIPTVEGATAGLPASDKDATPNGQALYVAVQIDRAAANNAPVATSVHVVYYDGYYVGMDGHPGYRWSFTARNCIVDTQNTDGSGSSQRYLAIDLSKGLTINVRPDDTLGYVVSVNGVDYCDGDFVGYFPDASVDGYGYNNLSDADIAAGATKWETSMTKAKSDINLNGLKTAGNGYLTVGAVSINDYSLSAHRCSYTVEKINGVAANDWAGQATAEHTCSFEFVESKAANCTYDGGDFYRCTVCGNYELRNTVPATGHTFSGNMNVIEEATCTRVGTAIDECTVCRVRKTEITPVLPHSWSEWIVTTEPTATAAGIESRTCLNCGLIETNEIPATGIECEHSWGEWEVTTAPTETESGEETRTCTLCGATETKGILRTGTDWKLTFDPDGGVMPEGVANEYGINTGENYKERTGIEYPVPTMAGYIFGGWYWDVYNFTLTVGDWDDGYFAVTQDAHMVALWEEDPNYDDGTLKVKSVENYTVSLKNVYDVKEIRFAIGQYTTVSQLKNAEGNLTLSASLAASFIKDGVFSYDVAYAGSYTFCIRHNDGTNDFLYVDVKDINTYLVSDGLRLTVTDMKAASEIRDMWIAQGTWTTYSEIKNQVAAGAKYQATSTKLANYFATNDFTYTCLAPGAHTVLIRYNDGTVEALHIDLTVDVPTFKVDGLQITIGNIPGVKIIRTALGEWNTVQELKKASLFRTFNNKTAIKDAESYMIQYRENAVYTVMVEYVTGYKHIEHINIQQKVPTFVQDGNKVTFGDLDGLQIIRYAPGAWKTSNGVKNAEGSMYIRPEAIVDGKIVVENLAAGTYTFCVQYKDDSYNFYVVTVE